MSKPILYGPPQSSYMRTARWTLSEKGIAHELQPVALGTEEHLALHPYGKVPILRHGDVQLFETQAICRYVDDVFDGPSLTPADPAARGAMEQWISVINCYLYPDGIRDYALQYIVPRGPEGKPDRKVIEAALPRLDRGLRLLDGAYAESRWITGEQLSLADLFVGPVVATIAMFPEGREAVGGRRHLSRAFEAMQAREAYRAIQPPAP